MGSTLMETHIHLSYWKPDLRLIKRQMEQVEKWRNLHHLTSSVAIIHWNGILWEAGGGVPGQHSWADLLLMCMSYSSPDTFPHAREVLIFFLLIPLQMSSTECECTIPHFRAHTLNDRSRLTDRARLWTQFLTTVRKAFYPWKQAW